jgi:SAM-dependent methyltransferase
MRKAADAVARSSALIPIVRRHLAGRPRTVVHDLGCGTGSMARWLAPRLSGPQHWIMHDRDPDLLEQAAAEVVDRAADGAEITIETRLCDVTSLTADDLEGASLVTASALLDLLTADEVERIAAACATAHCPALLAISVDGRVILTPPDPLDAPIARAFNAHQRRTTDGRDLLGRRRRRGGRRVYPARREGGGPAESVAARHGRHRPCFGVVRGVAGGRVRAAAGTGRPGCRVR